MTVLSVIKTRVNDLSDSEFGMSAIVPGGSLTSREVFDLYSRGGAVDSVISSSSEQEFREVTEIRDPLIARQYVNDLHQTFINDVQSLQQQQQQQQQRQQQHQEQQLPGQISIPNLESSPPSGVS